jgi:hypothetical protein
LAQRNLHQRWGVARWPESCRASFAAPVNASEKGRA